MLFAVLTGGVLAGVAVWAELSNVFSEANLVVTGEWKVLGGGDWQVEKGMPQR